MPKESKPTPVTRCSLAVPSSLLTAKEVIRFSQRQSCPRPLELKSMPAQFWPKAILSSCQDSVVSALSMKLCRINSSRPATTHECTVTDLELGARLEHHANNAQSCLPWLANLIGVEYKLAAPVAGKLCSTQQCQLFRHGFPRADLPTTLG